MLFSESHLIILALDRAIEARATQLKNRKTELFFDNYD